MLSRLHVQMWHLMEQKSSNIDFCYLYKVPCSLSYVKSHEFQIDGI